VGSDLSAMRPALLPVRHLAALSLSPPCALSRPLFDGDPTLVAAVYDGDGDDAMRRRIPIVVDAALHLSGGDGCDDEHFVDDAPIFLGVARLPAVPVVSPLDAAMDDGDDDFFVLPAPLEASLPTIAELTSTPDTTVAHEFTHRDVAALNAATMSVATPHLRFVLHGRARASHGAPHLATERATLRTAASSEHQDVLWHDF
jgi:hypothetical protein